MNTDPAGANAVLADIERGDDPIPLSELPGKPFIPKKRGRKPHQSCAFRWAGAGLRGHRLETARCGVIVTTRSAVIRFFSKLSGVEASNAFRPPGRRERAIARAITELEIAGL